MELKSQDTPMNECADSALVPFDFVHGMSAHEFRTKVVALEATMHALPDSCKLHIEPKHYFTPGLYAREIFIPKGTLLVGKIHKTEHMAVMLKGDISDLTEEGLKRINTPCTLISKPGIKRAGFAHEDTVWVTFHATTETDLKKLESDLTVESFAELECARTDLLEGDK